MKTQIISPLLALALSAHAFSQDLNNQTSPSKNDVQAATKPLPLIVTPPQSSGINQGFSRPPSRGVYDEEKGILVTEFLSRTPYRSPNGNNSRFIIIEYSIDPKGKELKRTSWEVFEGTSTLANEHTVSYECISPYTFRETLGDGEYRIYKLILDSHGKLKQFEQTFYGKNGAILSKHLIFSR